MAPPFDHEHEVKDGKCALCGAREDVITPPSDVGEILKELYLSSMDTGEYDIECLIEAKAQLLALLVSRAEKLWAEDGYGGDKEVQAVPVSVLNSLFGHQGGGRYE